MAPNFHWGHLFTDDDLTVNHSNVEFLEGIPDGVPIDFQLTYDPQDGDGTITFVLGDEPEVVFELDLVKVQIAATYVTGQTIHPARHGGCSVFERLGCRFQ